MDARHAPVLLARVAPWRTCQVRALWGRFRPMAFVGRSHGQTVSPLKGRLRGVPPACGRTSPTWGAASRLHRQQPSRNVSTIRYRVGTLILIFAQVGEQAIVVNGAQVAEIRRYERPNSYWNNSTILHLADGRSCPRSGHLCGDGHWLCDVWSRRSRRRYLGYGLRFSSSSKRRFSIRNEDSPNGSRDRSCERGDADVGSTAPEDAAGTP